MPAIVDNDERVCFYMSMPDQLEYRAALMGKLADMSLWFNWEHTQADYLKDHEKQNEVAQLWAETMIGASFEVCMDFCQQMIDCINGTPGVIEAISTNLQNSPKWNEYLRLSAIKATAELIGSKLVEECSRPVLAGQVIAIVDAINETNVNFLEIVEVGTNDEERVSRLIGAIPGIGVLPADEILNTFQEFLADFKENYDAAITLSWKDDVEQDLYCIAQESEDCKLTFAQVFTYFKDRAGAELTLGSLITNIVQFVINGDFSTDELVASGMYAIALGFMMTGREFGGSTIPLLRAIAKDADPSDRWEDWPDCFPSEVVPVIDPNGPWWDEARGVCGTIVPDVDGYYIATATVSGGAYFLGIAEASGQDFVVVDAQWLPGCACWGYTGPSEYFNACAGNGWVATSDAMTRIAGGQGGSFQFRFKISPAV